MILASNKSRDPQVKFPAGSLFSRPASKAEAYQNCTRVTFEGNVLVETIRYAPISSARLYKLID